MRNFDTKRDERKARDRMFQIGGETFLMKPGVRPEALIPFQSVSTDTPAEEQLEIIDGLVLEMIEQGGEGQEGRHKWLSIRARTDDPLTLEDLQDLVEWLIEVQVGRSPTRPSSPSSNGQEPTETTSTAVSSLPEPTEA